jgi:hypothetical protein
VTGAGAARSRDPGPARPSNLAGIGVIVVNLTTYCLIKALEFLGGSLAAVVAAEAQPP